MPTIMLLCYDMFRMGYVIMLLNIAAGLFPQLAMTSVSCIEMPFLHIRTQEKVETP